MSTRREVGSGWAVRIKPTKQSTAWVHDKGVYLPERYGRSVWTRLYDAKLVAGRWYMFSPVLVLVRFFTVTPARKGARR